MVNQAKRYELRLYDRALLVFSAMADAFGNVSFSVLDSDDDARSLPPPDARPETELPQRVARYARRAEEPTIRGQDPRPSRADPRRHHGHHRRVPGPFDQRRVLGGSQRVRGHVRRLQPVRQRAGRSSRTDGLHGIPLAQHRRAGLSTEWTTDGQYPKAWRRIDDALLLFKAGTEGYANSGMEPYSEFFAAQAAEAFGIPHVDYDLEKWQGKLASVCPLMHDKDTAVHVLENRDAVLARNRAVALPREPRCGGAGFPGGITSGPARPAARRPPAATCPSTRCSKWS